VTLGCTGSGRRKYFNFLVLLFIVDLVTCFDPSGNFREQWLDAVYDRIRIQQRLFFFQCLHLDPL